MKKLATTILWFCQAIYSNGQELPIVNSENLALGHIQSTLENAWNTYTNPSLLASSSRSSLAFNINSLHGLKELSTSSIAGCLNPNKFMGYGIVYAYRGYHAANQQVLLLGTGRKLTDNISLGVSLGYQRGEFGREKPIRSIPLVIGSVYRLSSSTRLSATFRSVWNQTIKSELRLGILWKSGESTDFHIEASQRFGQRSSFQMGLTHQVAEKITLLIGAGYQPSLFSFGFRFKTGSLKLISGTSRHQTLGFTPSMGFVYEKEHD